MIKEPKVVTREIINVKPIINFDNYTKYNIKLDDYIQKLKGIRTTGKGDTWGRIYVEIPSEVLFKFGIISNSPIVSYLNMIMNNEHYYCYPGTIFSGDAAWFDQYQELNEKEIKESYSYQKLKLALENNDCSKSFYDFYDTAKDKWKIVPIHNEEIAKIAYDLNNHLK